MSLTVFPLLPLEPNIESIWMYHAEEALALTKAVDATILTVHLMVNPNGESLGLEWFPDPYRSPLGNVHKPHVHVYPHYAPLKLQNHVR